MNAGEPLDSHSHGRGRWFDPSIAHSKRAILQVKHESTVQASDISQNPVQQRSETTANFIRHLVRPCTHLRPLGFPVARRTPLDGGARACLVSWLDFCRLRHQVISTEYADILMFGTNG
jgi:hypothetical protein